MDTTATSMPITKLREEIMHLPELLDEDKKVTITRRGYPVAIIVSYESYNRMREDMERMNQEIEAMRETIEILQDAELMETIRESMEAIQRGDTVSLEEARRALGLE
jgi:prevent-host-death family protein